MGRHSAPGGDTPGSTTPLAVTLERAAAALEGLGFDPIVRPDRLVVGAYAFVAAVWVHHERPLMLAVDAHERIPTDFAHASRVARFINTWNHDRVGPFASYRLLESGDVRVGMRRGVHIKHGLNDEQLLAELADIFEHAAMFFQSLRERFLDAGWDQPLPPALARAQDFDALLGRHPSARHLPAGTEKEVTYAPELFDAAGTGAGSEHYTTPAQVRTASLADALETLSFSHAVDPGNEVVATGVNGVPFALTVDGGDAGSRSRYARVTAMWDTGLDADEDFLRVWLLCNDVNERSAAVSTYLHEHDGVMHLHAEATLVATAGASPAQLDEFVLSSMVAGLAAVDYLSRLTQGHSAVEWPPQA